MLDCLCCAVYCAPPHPIGRLECWKIVKTHITVYSLLFLLLHSALCVYFIISPSLSLSTRAGLCILVVSHFAWRHRNLIRKNYTVKNNLVNLLVSAVNRNIPRNTCENRIIHTLSGSMPVHTASSSPHAH